MDSVATLIATDPTDRGAPTAVPGGTYPFGETKTVRYAGFWKRYWGALIDSLVGQLIVLLLAVPYFVVLSILGVLGTVDSFESESWALGWGALLASIAFGIIVLAVFWRVFIRRFGVRGSTPGMFQMGIRARPVDHDGLIGSGAIFVRFLMMFAINLFTQLVAVGIIILLFGSPTESVDKTPALWAMSGAVFFVLLIVLGPYLWMLVDRRFQTPWDKAVGVVVHEEKKASWWAVASLVFVSTGVLFPLALICSHVATWRISRSRSPQAGEGLARVVMVVCYAALALTVVGYSRGTIEDGRIQYGAADNSQDTDPSSDQKVLARILDPAPSLPPDLVRLPSQNRVGAGATNATRFGDDTCERKVFRDPIATDEARYISRSESPKLLPESLSVWVGSYAENAVDVPPISSLGSILRYCSFYDGPLSAAFGIQPILVVAGNGNWKGTATIPYVDSAKSKTAVTTLYVSMALEGRFAVFVKGLDRARVQNAADEALGRVKTELAKK